jgi:hypothetical protein
MVIFIFVSLIVLIFLVTHYYIVPQKDKVNIVDMPSSYFIESENRIDIQRNFECAAFSSAYLLRHFNIDTDGNELYKKFPQKLFDGNVAPKGIINIFRKYDYNAFFYKGNILTLKKRISEGIPVIVFTKVFPEKRYLHFAPAIGYDEEYIYFAESLKYLINCNERRYNRKISIVELNAIWKTWIPLYENTYVLIRP